LRETGHLTAFVEGVADEQLERPVPLSMPAVASKTW
jgi:hypothetical protein